MSSTLEEAALLEEASSVIGGRGSFLLEASLCWQRLCVGGGMECPLEDAAASCWRRLSAGNDCVLEEAWSVRWRTRRPHVGSLSLPLEEASEDAAGSCWRRVFTVRGDINDILEEVLSALWKRLRDAEVFRSLHQLYVPALLASHIPYPIPIMDGCG